MIASVEGSPGFVMPAANGQGAVGQTAAQDDLDEAAVEAALSSVPRGALALSGLTVALLLLAWLLIYFLVFLPRGMVS